MSETPPAQAPTTDDPLEGCTRLTVVLLGALIAPLAAGCALGVAFITGGEVIFGAFNLPQGADMDLAIVFLLALIVMLLATLFAIEINPIFRRKIHRRAG